jgi:hypothetical protein
VTCGKNNKNKGSLIFWGKSLGRPNKTLHTLDVQEILKFVANLKLIQALIPKGKLDLASWQNSNVRLAIWEYRPGNVALRFANVDMRHCNMVE